MEGSSDRPQPSGSSAGNIYYSSNPVELTNDEIERLQQQDTVSDFVKIKLEKDAKKNWDLFYKRNGDRFFKHRYWTKREFEELFAVKDVGQTSERYLLEIGCGCGDFALPLIESGCKFFIYCCDFSDKAIEILTNKDLYKQQHKKKVFAFVADATVRGQLEKGLDSTLMDIVSMIFVLSALDPKKMKDVIQNVMEIMKPGGIVIFRDYALYDFAMLRFKAGQKIGDNYYFRQDGTRAYFFDKDEVSTMFSECGFDIVSLEYVRRETVNIGENLHLRRVFVQGKFRKPFV